MYFSTLFASALALATATLAAPTPDAEPSPQTWRGGLGYKDWGRNNKHKQCLTVDDAAQAADIFRQLIQAYTPEMALEALTEDFIDYSSAVNIIRNRGNPGPFITNSISFNGRAAFMAAQGSQPPIPFDTLNVFHGCNHTAVRWQTTRSANGQKTEANNIPVVGNAILETVPDADNKYGFRVKTLFSEFNAAAWLVNNGVFTPVPRNATKREEEGEVYHLM